MTTNEFIAIHKAEDVADLALRLKQYPEVDAAYALVQIAGWQKAVQKLPELANIKGWIWPKKLSMEQCSSEETARIKRQIIGDTYTTGADLTGGAGVDSYYLSERAETWHYVEQQEDLCTMAEHNFRLVGRPIRVHHCSAESFAESMPDVDVAFIDPARRNVHGGKVFKLEDCSPNLSTLLPSLLPHCKRLLIKLSPMLDISEAMRQLSAANRAYIIAVRNEVKELLIFFDKESKRNKESEYTDNHLITAINIMRNSAESYSFTEAEEAAAIAQYLSPIEPVEGYLYEPNAAILKAGAFRLMSERYAVRKLGINTHLYQSDELVEAFPGRIWKIQAVVDKTKQKLLSGQQANILTRNYPLKPDDIRKKLKLRDGGEQYIIGARIADKAVLLLADRIK